MQTRTAEERDAFHNVWVIAEHRWGETKAVTFELLSAARDLADKRGSEVWCILLGDGVRSSAAACIASGADVAVVVDAPALSEFVDQTYADFVSRFIATYRPEIVLCGATAYGRALAPRIAVQVDAGLTADCTSLEIDPESGDLLQTRPAFGGNIMATIRAATHRPQMATVRPRVLDLPTPDPGRSGRIVEEQIEPDDVTENVRIIRTIRDNTGTVPLADARFIIAGGRGVQGKEGFELLKSFAETVGGAVAASRAAVDAGWIDYAHQIGQTGQTVQPRVYVACGVSGQIQHLVGMQSANLIIAINRDRHAPIMQFADYAIVGDLFEILPAMMDEIRQL